MLPKESFMEVEINWRSPALVSGLHAADALGRKLPFADTRLEGALQVPAAQLAAEIRAAHLPPDRFWRHLIPLAANLEVRRQLVETAVTKTAGRGPRFEPIVTNLSASIAAVDAAVRATLPQLADELALRQRPLREQWDGRGGGMLREIGRLTDEALLVPKCDVLLVYPALGGGGDAHLPYNSVRIEAVLANAVAELPEVVRLAWLIAQLQLDRPIYSESIHADRLPHVARYAILPAVLAAAETVELVRFTPEIVRLAVAGWRLAAPAGVDAAALTLGWWQTYQQDRPPWNVALAALDQMFG
jgi:hypothetical protein